MAEPVIEPSAGEDTGVKLAKVTEPSLPENGAGEVGVPSTSGDTKMDGTEESTSGKSSDTDMKALKQIEFYFSDANLPYDKFMWTLHTKQADNWVPLSTIAGFKRMSEFKPLGLPHLAEVIRKSTSGLLEVDAEGTNIRRVLKLVPPSTSGQFDRSVYAKGFGEEKPGLQKELEAFFEKYGPINAVRMRRKDKKRDGCTDFKGSAFCEYKTQDGVDAFLNADPKPKWGDTELLIMTKGAYVSMKAKEKGFSVPDRTAVLPGNKSRSFNAFKLMEQDAKKSGKGATADDDAESEDEEIKKVVLDGLELNIQEDGTVDPEALSAIPKGKVLQWKGAGEGRDPYSAIKRALHDAFPKAPFIKTLEGGSGYAGFSTVLKDEEVDIVREKVPKILGKEVTWERLPEDEELAYWTSRANELAQKALEGDSKPTKSSSRGRGGGGRGRGRGGRGGRGGGKSDRSTNQNKRKRDDHTTKEGEASTTKGAVPVVASAKKTKVDGES